MLKLKLLLFLVLLPKQFNFSLGFIILSPFRLFLIALVPWVLFSLFSKKRFKWCSVDTLAVLVSVWPIISLSISSSFFGATESGGIYFLEIFVPYFLARLSVTSYEKLQILTKYFLFIISIVAILALPELITGKYYVHNFLDGIFGTVSIQPSGRRFGLWRSTGVTDHPIILGAMCSIGFILSLALMMKRSKYVYYTGVSFLGVIASVSSAPLLAMVSQFGLFLWARLMKMSRLKWVILVIILIVLYIAIDILSNRTPLKVMFSYLLFNPHNGYVRYYMWVNSIFLINQTLSSAIFGYGLQAVPFHLVENIFFSRLMSVSVDSFWLVNLLRYGWTMFGLWALLIFSALRQSRLQYKKMQNDRFQKIISESWLILVISFTLISLSVDLWGGMKSVFMVILACACTRTPRVQDDVQK
ncbi:MAG: hypothetical protein ACRBEE_06300 [Arenicella sp.]